MPACALFFLIPYWSAYLLEWRWAIPSLWCNCFSITHTALVLFSMCHPDLQFYFYLCVVPTILWNLGGQRWGFIYLCFPSIFPNCWQITMLSKYLLNEWLNNLGEACFPFSLPPCWGWKHECSLAVMHSPGHAVLSFSPWWGRLRERRLLSVAILASLFLDLKEGSKAQPWVACSSLCCYLLFAARD